MDANYEHSFSSKPAESGSSHFGSDAAAAHMPAVNQGALILGSQIAGIFCDETVFSIKVNTKFSSQMRY